jgi:hypothetical protein
MKTRVSLALLAWFTAQIGAAPLGTAFTYQGQLSEGTLPANGIYDFRFAVYDLAAGGSAVAGPLTNAAVLVSNGLFTAVLDFGANPFTGDTRWLAIDVKTNGAASYTPLTPRQPLAPTPYALYAPNAGSATMANSFTGLLGGDVTGNQAGTAVISVGGQSAAYVAAGASTANAATAASTPGALVKRDASGNFAAGTIAANLSGNAATVTHGLYDTGAYANPAWITSLAGGKIAGDISGNAFGFTGSLAGDVTGGQGTTVVSSVGGLSAANVATGASAANAATAANTPGAIVQRDGSGNFSAGAITAASLSGDGSGLNNLNGGSIAGGTITCAQLAPGAALTNLTASGQSGVPSGALVLGNANNAAAMIAAGYTSLGPAYVGETWLPTPTAGAPSARRAHTAVWTGKELIIWGGYNGSVNMNDGARYNPISNLWLSVNAANAPAARDQHMAVWTGTEMLIWGGMSSTNAGGRYNPVTDTWSPMSTNGAPIGWYYSSAVWSGTEMLVWGGQIGNGPTVNTGARYNPKTDTWTALTTNGAPSARGYHTAVWTGTEMIIWGGYNGSANVNDGARYNPVTATWTSTSLAGAPSARDLHAAVWTGSEMVVWGGVAGTTYPITGGRYNPVTDIWRATTTSEAPVGRYWNWPVAAWTGTEMLVWGGANGVAVQSGGRYNPGTDVWTAMTITGAPAARYTHTGTWTDNGYIVFGGFFDSANYFAAAASYIPGRLMYLYLRP